MSRTYHIDHGIPYHIQLPYASRCAECCGRAAYDEIRYAFTETEGREETVDEFQLKVGIFRAVEEDRA